MLLAYVDESGDTGDPTLKGSSSCFALGCVLVELNDWPGAFDAVLALRRRLRDTFGVLLRHELKANYLIRGSGPIGRLNLSPNARHRIFRSHMLALQHIPARAFGVVTDKASIGLVGQACFDETWSTLLQRLERTSHYENDKPIMIFHDDGENDAVRKLVRRSRRYLTAGKAWGGGHHQNNIPNLIDDPSPRASDQSYFVQIADLLAYAAWRSYMAPGAGAARVCPQGMWDLVGPARHVATTGLRPRGAPAVVIRK